MEVPIQDKVTRVDRGAPKRPLSAKIIRNSLSGSLRLAVWAPIPFIMTPFILHKIGVQGYGTWAVFLAINGLTSLADLGLVGTVSKFVAEYHAQRDFVALGRLLNSGLALFLLLIFVIGTAFWAASPLLAGWLFHGSSVQRSELVSLFRCFLAVIATNILTLLFSSVTTGMQRLDLTNIMSSANVLSSAIFGAVLLGAGWGLRGLVYGYVGSGILTVIAYLIIVRKLLPQVRLNPLGLDRAEARKMFGFSLRLYFTQAAMAVHNQVEKVFLASMVGVAAVGWYDIASDLALKVRGGIGLILGPVLPAASELHALGDERRVKELFYRAHKYLALAGVPIVCFLTFISGRFIELWLGSGFKMVALPLSVLLVVSFFNLMTGPGFLILAGLGDLRPGVQSAIVGIVLNVILSLALIYKYGFEGAVLGTSASLLVAAAYFQYLFFRQTGYALKRLIVESYLKPVICACFALATATAIHPSGSASWMGLVVMGIEFGTVYSCVILLSRFFDEYDWNKLEVFWPAVGRARKFKWVG